MRSYRNIETHRDEILLPTKDGYVAVPAPGVRAPDKTPDRFFDRKRQKPSWSKIRVLNILHFSVMLSGMFAVMAYLGYAIGGLAGLTIVSALGIGLFLGSSNLKIEHILRLKKARLIHPYQGQTLYNMLDKLASTGGLSKSPALFFSDSPEINAYTVSDKEKSAIVLSRGLLDHLNQRELYGVLAHEAAHLKNNDVRVMVLAEQIRKITGMMALIGQILLFLNLPLILLGQLIAPWSFIILLMGAPFINMLLMVAISRNREYKADLDAALMTGDPLGLASALKKISLQNRFWSRLYAPYLRNIPEILRTHPGTSERIRRLDAIHREERLSWRS